MRTIVIPSILLLPLSQSQAISTSQQAGRKVVRTSTHQQSTSQPSQPNPTPTSSVPFTPQSQPPSQLQFDTTIETQPQSQSATIGSSSMPTKSSTSPTPTNANSIAHRITFQIIATATGAAVLVMVVAVLCVIWRTRRAKRRKMLHEEVSNRDRYSSPVTPSTTSGWISPRSAVVSPSRIETLPVSNVMSHAKRNQFWGDLNAEPSLRSSLVQDDREGRDSNRHPTTPGSVRTNGSSRKRDLADAYNPTADPLPDSIDNADRPIRRLTTSLRKSLFEAFKDGKRDDAQRRSSNDPSDNSQRNSKRSSFFWSQQQLPGFLQAPQPAYAANPSNPSNPHMLMDSEGSRSVASIQWIGFNRSMDAREQEPSRKSGFFVTNTHSESKRSSQTNSVRSSRRSSGVLGMAGGAGSSRVDVGTQEEELWPVRNHALDDDLNPYRESIDSVSAVRTATLIKSIHPITSSVSGGAIHNGLANANHHHHQISIASIAEGAEGAEGEEGGNKDYDGGPRDKTAQGRPSFQTEEHGAPSRNSPRGYVEERGTSGPGWPRPMDQPPSPTLYGSAELPPVSPVSPISNMRYSAFGGDMAQGDVWANVLEALENEDEEYSREQRSG